MLNKELIIADKNTKKKLEEVIGYLEIVYSLSTLEYHDKNLLCNQLAVNPNLMNNTQREIIRRCLDMLGTTAAV